MKAKIRKTGEIVDVIAFKSSEACPEKSWVRYVDSEGLDRTRKLNALKDLEIIDKTEDKAVDWEQRRYELAKSAMNGILSDENEVGYACSEAKYEKNEKYTTPKAVAQYAVACADALIDELRKGGEK